MGVIDLFLYDLRVQIVVALVFFAILIALFLTYLEINARNQRDKRKVFVAKEYFIKKIQREIKSKKTALEKLDFLDKTAKDYFHKAFGSPSGDYSELEIFFNKKKLVKPAYFSRSMFEAYYSMNELNDSTVDSLVKGFIEIYRETEAEKLPELNPFKKKIEKIIYVEEKKKGNVFDYVSLASSKFFSFFSRILSRFFGLFKTNKRSIEREWTENFEDVDKEMIIRKFEDEGQYRMRHALLLKEKEVAQQKLEELRRKKNLKEEERKKMKEFESFLNRNKKEDHFIFYGQ